MLSSRRLTLFLPVFLTLLALPSPAPAKTPKIPGQWIEIPSEHFLVISNARPNKAKKVSEHFEQIHALMTREMPTLAKAENQRLKVFAPANEKSLKLMLPAYWQDRRRTKPAGVFRRDPGDRLIIVRADLLDSGAFDIIYHEYFHYLANRAKLELPTWLSEGLADYWGAGTRLTRKNAEVGRPLSYRLQVLQGANLLPLEDLLAADRSSPLYREGQSSLFYAQSWALTHLIQLGDPSGELREGLVKYLGLVAAGRGSLEAARESFGDLDELRLRLRSYVRQLTFSYGKLPPVPAFDEKNLEIIDISKPKVAGYLARFLPSGRSVVEVKGLYDQALTHDPGDVLALEARGRYQLALGELEEGVATFEKASSSPNATAMSHYGLAVARFQRALADGSLDAENLKGLEPLLQTAIEKNDQFAPAFARLADVYSRLDGDVSARANTAINRAIALQPDFSEYRLLRARLLHNAGKEVEAFQIARAEAMQQVKTGTAFRNNAVCWTGALTGLAEAVLPACERAVELSPDSFSILDSRGVARIFVADYPGAAADLKRALELGKDRWDEESRASRSAWVAALEKGESPFPEGPTALSGELGLGWLY